MELLERRDAVGLSWEVERVHGTDGVAVLVLSREWPLPSGSIVLDDVPGRGVEWRTDEGPAGFHFVATPDLDGDGVDDLAGSFYVNAAREDVFARSGKTGDVLFLREGPDETGLHVASVDDVDGDGVPDLVAGAYVVDAGERGRVFALSGADGALLWSVEGAVEEYLGLENLVTVADRDGDGRRDVATQSYASRFSTVPILSSTDGARIDEIAEPDVHLVLCREASDVDGDGVPELLLQTTVGGVTTLHVRSDAHGDLWTREGFGCAAFGTRDVDADGLDDVLAAEGPEAPGRALVGLSGTTGEERFRSVSGGALGADVAEIPELDLWASVDRRRDGGLWIWKAVRGE